MKNTSALKNTTRSILIASVMFGVTGMVHAQSSTAKTAKKQGSSMSSPAAHTYGKDAARDYAISQGSGSHTYGKDQSADYAKSQGSGFHAYGKDSASDYSMSQGSSSTGTVHWDGIEFLARLEHLRRGLTTVCLFKIRPGRQATGNPVFPGLVGGNAGLVPIYCWRCQFVFKSLPFPVSS